jgi:uncharacterized protein (TIGR03435 family)
MDLLRQYTDGSSDAAFAALVSRHVDLVYSAALRKTGNPHAAEEITQAVFIILAQKAGRILDKTILPGWLYQTARLTASSFLRRETRRVRREQEAFMLSQFDQPQSDLSRRSETEADETWEQLAPLLEDAMGQLGDKDRAAVVLRFFGGKSFAEVATAAGVSENAAKKRVSHALEKLHRYFAKRGVSSTTAIIAGAISANSVQAAPMALAKTVSAVAIAKSAAASGSTLTLIKGALKIMAWTKAKTVIVASAAVLFATGTTVVVVEKAGSHGVAESFWKMKLENLKKAPPVVIIRPPRYSDYSAMVNDDGKVIAHNMTFGGLLQEAYSSSPVRTVLPTNIPQGRFDLMLTLPSDQKSALRREIQKKFGFIARHENIKTNVLLLTVKDANLLAAHRSKLGNREHYKHDAGFMAYSNVPISELARDFERPFQLPVVLQGGCAGNYDFQRQASKAGSESEAREQTREFIRDGLEKIGLELVPATTTLEMLVVEKAPTQGGKDTFLEPLVESDYAPRIDSALQGRWEGTVKRGQTPLQVSLRIAERAENTFRAEADIPKMQQTNVQATSFSFSHPTVIIEFGELANTIFEGNLADNGKEIKGTVTGAGEVWPLTFNAVENP